MIIRGACTPHYTFCAVKTGYKPAPLDPTEPFKVAKAIKEWRLKYVVITSACRDDLDDRGANHICNTVKAIKMLCPNTIVEPLIPDLQGNVSSNLCFLAADVGADGMQTKETAQQIIEAIRINYNFVREHSTLKKTPAEQAGIKLELGETKIEI
jgi:lipoic acid synthetase